MERIVSSGWRARCGRTAARLVRNVHCRSDCGDVVVRSPEGDRDDIDAGFFMIAFSRQPAEDVASRVDNPGPAQR